ncbi:MAG: glycoside hydrolase domain-containing protein, partial [Flavobacteriaceae bacterium]
NGNKFQISAPNNSKENVYINSATLNGEIWNKSFIKFNSIQSGGQIDFRMSDKPNKKWAANRESVPYSLSKTDDIENKSE